MQYATIMCKIAQLHAELCPIRIPITTTFHDDINHQLLHKHTERNASADHEHGFIIAICYKHNICMSHGNQAEHAFEHGHRI